MKVGVLGLGGGGSPLPVAFAEQETAPILEAGVPAGDCLRELGAHGPGESETSLPKRVPKPWGYELWFAHTDAYAGKVLHVDRGHRLSLQYHEHKDESCYLVRGRLLLVKGTSPDELEQWELGPGSAWRNLPGQLHTIEALEDSDVLEVSTPELDDVVRISDQYGREGTTAP